MYSREEVSKIIEQHIASIKFPGEPESLYEPIKYSLEGGGKRMRPILTLMACNLYKDDIKDAVPAAAAVEMFHTFTLMHDDIMDNADIRRGKSAVHRQWNQNIAILSGDAMVLCAYQQLQKTPTGILPEVMCEFNKLAIEVCEGQQIDIDFETREDVSIDEYMNMIRLKTAVLMAGASKIGAIGGGADKKDADALYRFGLELGLAYQLQDDYLDTYGTAEVLGKNIGGDIAESKKTFLLLKALEEAGAATRRAMLATLRDDTHPLPHKLSRMKTIYNSLDIPEITLKAINLHLGNAGKALDELSVDAERTTQMRDLLQALHNRNK